MANEENALRRALGTKADWLHAKSWRLWTAIAIASYTLLGFLVVPWVARAQIVKQLGATLERPVALESLRMNPYALSVEALGFSIAETDGSPLIAFDRLYVNLEFLSLLRFAWVFKEVSLEGARVEVRREADGTVTLERLAPPPSGEADTASNDGGLPRLLVRSLSLVDTRINITDETRPTTFTLPVGPIDARLDGLSTLPDDVGSKQITVVTEGGTTLSWVGELELRRLASSGRVEGGGSVLPIAYRYFQDELGVVVERGELEFGFDYRLQTGEDGHSLTVDGFNLAVNDAHVTRLGTETVSIPELRLEGGAVRYPERTASLERVLLRAPRLAAWRNEDGTLSIERFLVQESQAGGASDQQAEPSGEALTSAPGDEEWLVELGEFRIEDLSFRFEDRALEDPGELAIADLDLTLAALSNESGARFPVELAIAIASGGNIRLNGNAAALPDPLLNAEVTVDDLQLAGIAPWVRHAVPIGVGGGSVALRADIAVDEGEQVAADGSLTVSGLDIDDLDKREDLVGWGEVAIDRYRLSLSERSLELSELRLSEPYLRLLIAEDQTTNFSRLLAGDAEAPAPPVESDSETEAFAVTVGRIVIDDGSMDFSDLSLPIAFSTRIEDLNSDIGTIATTSAAPTSLDLSGQVDDYGLARIDGSLVAIGPTEATDIRMLFRNVELPDLTPYTVRFAGREVAEGRMDLDLRYRIEDGILDASNEIVIRDLRLGEKIDHPGAMNLPLGLAIGLLKGPDGRIDITVPVEGDVNDPEFRIGGVIAQAVANVILNVVSAPFRLLGSLVGVESEDFDRIEFEPGSAELTPPEREKIDKLAEALGLRPELGLEIRGVADPDDDLAALKALSVDTAIDAALADDEDTERMLAERRRVAVESLFTARFPEELLDTWQERFTAPVDPEQPDGEKRFDEFAYVAGLRERLIETEAAGEPELDALAESRAAVVVAELVDREVDASRIESDIGRAEINDSGWIPMKLELTSAD